MSAITGKKRIRRTIIISMVLIALMSVTLMTGMYLLDSGTYYGIVLLLILECLFPVYFAFKRRKPQAGEIVLLASLCALGVAVRIAFYSMPECIPVLAIVIVIASSLGSGFGFLTGAVIMLVSDLVLGVGIWTPGQMLAVGLVGGIAGQVVARSSYIEKERKWNLSVCFYGFTAALLVYGPIINVSTMLFFEDDSDTQMLTGYLFWWGLPFDLLHAITTAILLLLLAVPMVEILERIKNKYGLFGSR